jgi:uncharacterized NAD(P)/FAD-binding protein YdhS
MNRNTSNTTDSKQPVVAIVGGGFSGAAVAYHLYRQAPGRLRIVVIEPRADLGRGLAYSAEDPSHRINVPAARMSLVPDEPEHFARWLESNRALASDPDAQTPDGRQFPSRSVFGDYVANAMQKLAQHIEHVRGYAHSLTKTNANYRIETSSGTIEANLVVLAVCHPPPAPPNTIADDVRSDPRMIGNPWLPDAFARIGRDDRVLIVGTGLTMADIVASLERMHHNGKILAISRRGLRSRGHPPVSTDPFGDFITEPARTTRRLVRSIRTTIENAADQGLPWHGVLDQVRLQGTVIWQALPSSERQRLLRHLRPFWDVHRFRIAPQIEATLDRKVSDGSLRIEPASIVAITKSAQEFAVTLRNRRAGKTDVQHFDSIVLATGPAHGRVFKDIPLLESLHRAGIARPDSLGLGIEVDLRGRAVGADGTSNPDIFVAGPLARGTFGELMGLPDVAIYAARIAGEAAKRAAEIDDFTATA